MKLPQSPPKVQIPEAHRMLENHGIDIEQCPNCKSGKMELVANITMESVAILKAENQNLF